MSVYSDGSSSAESALKIDQPIVDQEIKYVVIPRLLIRSLIHNLGKFKMIDKATAKA
jgi:hypothetical protein